MKDWIRNIGDVVRRFLQRHSAAVAAVAISLISVLTMTGMTVSLRPVTINDGGHVFSIATFCRHTDTILAKAGVSLQPKDVVSASLEGEQPHIEITRSFEVPIMANGEVLQTVRMLDGTVADAIAEAGLLANTYDLVGCQPTDVLTAETVIEIAPYESTLRTETEVLTHGEQLTFTDDLPAGSRRVDRAGVDGKVERVLREYYKDGVLMTTETVEETVTEAVTELATVGNGSLSISPIPLELDENGRPLSYKSVLTGDACAYYFKKGTKTATGTYCKNGVVAVNPEIIPYGTKMFIIADDGYVYGYAEARDTGIAVRENIIIADLFMETYKQTCQFGRRHVSIYILE